MHLPHLVIVLLFAYSSLATDDKQKKKKDPRDFTDADIDRLYDEWEENDEEPLPDDEKPEHLRPKPNVDFEEIRQKAKSPEDMLKMSKKGQPVMMFVNVVDPSSTGKPTRSFTDKLSERWQSNLYNNHIDANAFVIDDDRLLFMFKEGSQAWEARKFFTEQPECKETTLEGQTQPGAGSKAKSEL
ncbi:LDLR chaperone boca-like protein [Aphelenchoides avenae]|nr:LDLR chaperone boca-like protein [Aphelenchus avenae]